MRKAVIDIMADSSKLYATQNIILCRRDNLQLFVLLISNIDD